MEILNAMNFSSIQKSIWILIATIQNLFDVHKCSACQFLFVIEIFKSFVGCFCVQISIQKTISMSFEEKVVLITGGSSGIGAACAEFFAKHGALLSLVGRDAKKFETVLAKVKACGGQTKPLVILADVTTDAERIICETIEKYEKLDILVNCAGFGTHATIENLKMEDFDTIMLTNVRSVTELTQLAVPHLIESKGNIVNVSSVAGIKPFTNYLAFSMSKAALDQFTKCTAMELAAKGVRVNSINPSFIDTNFHTSDGIERGGDEYAALVERNSSANPLDRIGYCKDCVNSIAFLANDKAGFITGVLLPVDGGIGAKGAY